MIDRDIQSALGYFRQFSYAPVFEELYIFLATPCTRDSVAKMTDNLVKKKQIIKIDCGDGLERYTLGGYGGEEKKLSKRVRASGDKRKVIAPFIAIITHVGAVQLVGLSGSVAMNNAQEGDDIDLFVIADTNRMFTVRFCLVLIAMILGQKRSKNSPKSHAANKVCLNMFFDKKDLQVPHFKQNRYVAHEVLQMKPLVNKNNMHERFLRANAWALGFYPNALQILQPKHIVAQPRTLSSLARAVWPLFLLIGDMIEYFLKQLQMAKINRGKTTEIITDTQLWFFPNDFEKKVRM